MRLPLIAPDDLYWLAVDHFGQRAANELTSLYSLVSTSLDGFNVPVPDRE